MSDWIGAAIGAAMSPITNAWAGNAQQHAQDFNASQLLVSQDFNSAEAAKTRDWQEQMRSTQYQTSVEDMRAAGLNPMLAYSQGGAGTLSGATASSGGGGGGAPAPVTNPALSAAAGAQVENMIKQNDLIDAQADKTRADAAEARARTETYPVSIDNMRAQIDSTRENINKIIQDTKTSGASAAYYQQQAANLRASIPQIQATIDQLKAQTKLTGSQNEKVVQQIQANLPALEAAFMKYKTAIEGAKVPQAQTSASLYQDPILGAAATLLDAFNPLKGFMK